MIFLRTTIEGLMRMKAENSTMQKTMRRPLEKQVSFSREMTRSVRRL
jgi:hypothetical protein